MSSIRAFELAKELGVPLANLKKEAKAVGVPVKGPLAALKDQEAEAIRSRFRAPPEEKAARTQAPSKRKKKAVSSKSAKDKIAAARTRATARVAPTVEPVIIEEPPPPEPEPEPAPPPPPPPPEPVVVEERVPGYQEILEDYIPPPAAKKPAVPAVAPPPVAPAEEAAGGDAPAEEAAEEGVAAEAVAAEVGVAEPPVETPAGGTVAGRVELSPQEEPQTSVVRAPAQPVAVPPPRPVAAPPAATPAAPPVAPSEEGVPAAAAAAETAPAEAPAAGEPAAAEAVTAVPPPAVKPPGSEDEAAAGPGVLVPGRKGPGLVRPAAPRPEPEPEPSMDRRFVPEPVEFYEASPRTGGKKRKKAKDRRKEAAAESAGRRPFKIDLSSDFVSTRITKKREKAKDKSDIEVTIPCTLKELSSSIGIKVNQLMTRLMRQGMMVGINDPVDRDIVELIAIEFELDVEVREQVEITQEDLISSIDDLEEDRLPRAPIVTFLGHVDHGKTSLLDKIRSSSVAEKEAGGITQHITCYRVDRGDKSVVFVDTPGHAAFSEMRARGANITDVVVLVVAADDGPMPQTEEAIAHARAAGVPIVVAINKVDKPDANVQLTKQKLAALGLQPEEWSGDSVMVEVSAHTGQGIDDLLEYLALESELLDLKANPKIPAVGTVLEARRTEGRGIVADVLVQNGTLRRGDIMLAGSSVGRVKQIFDTYWNQLKEAEPATPVWVTGLNEIPDAGENFLVLQDLPEAQEQAERHRTVRRQRELVTKRRRHTSLESLFADLEADGQRELRLIIKADVAGTLDAIRSEIAKLPTDDISVTIIHSAAGGITEGDVALADASDAVILGFHVTTEERARSMIKARGVEVRQYSVIYKILDDLKAAMEGLLEPDEVIEIIGHAEVRQVFRASKIGSIAGCRVTDGFVRRNSFVRVARNNIILYPSDETVKRGVLASLRRVKDDVREVKEGAECGVKITYFDDVKVDDVLEFYEIKKVKRKLQA